MVYWCVELEPVSQCLHTTPFRQDLLQCVYHGCSYRNEDKCGLYVMLGQNVRRAGCDLIVKL